MQAIVLRKLGGPEQLALESVVDPAPGAGEAIVRLRAAALNHRDAWIRVGQYAGIKLPVIPGSDGAGTVTELGEGVDVSWLGREVVINPSLDWGTSPRVQGASFRILGLPDDGTYAECVKVPVTNLFAKPSALSWHEAAAIPLAGLTAWRALVTRARVLAGETVVITGIGGGVATLALALARHLGARVAVTSGHDAKIERARALGAMGGVNYKTADWGKTLLTLCGGAPDVIIDSGGREAFPTLIDIIKPGGRLVTFGSTTGSAATIELRRIFWKQIDVLGTTMGRPDEFEAMLAAFGTGVAPVVDRVFPLGEAAEAHRRMERADQFGKIVLDIP
jgi:zinc-binding alcohol dehydrogenase/oxidoreductase